MKVKINDIGIVTIHRIANYGSLLQVFALQTKLQEMGYSVVVIDYVPERLRLFNLAKKTNLKQPIKTLAVCAKFIIHLRSSIRISRFIKQNIAISPRRYHSNNDLKMYPPNADIFLTGSDQVWNSTHNACIDKAYFLDFVPKNKMRISYAASFGREDVESSEIEIIKTYLSKFHKISVREKSAVKILNDANFQDISQHLDPVFLITKKQWQNYLHKSEHKNNQKKYVVIYEVNNENIAPLMENARKIASIKNVEIHFIKTTQKSKLIDECDKIYKNLSPFEFIDVINNAEYVISGSFHGAAFSIILNKTFFIVYPRHFSTRLKNILEIFNLTNRVISEDSDLEQMTKPINYSDVNSVIEYENAKAIEYFKNNLHPPLAEVN